MNTPQAGNEPQDSILLEPAADAGRRAERRAAVVAALKPLL
ncbi:MAG: hypothetical protein RJA44_36, partial [Pseudomonadota bacterium]